MQWIYLSKKGEDEYINRMAQGAGAVPTVIEDWEYNENPQAGIVLRGIMKHKLIKKCWADGRKFRFMDTGYFGNRPNPLNRAGWKVWHRIVPNDLQHNQIISRPGDRWDQLKINTKPFRKTGRNILIVAPDEKPCIFYDTTLDNWLEQTIKKLKQHTDRPIVIRHRNPEVVKNNRIVESSFEFALADAWAVITFNSNAGTESILNGVPVFVTQAANAARPLALDDLSKIETPYYPDSGQVRNWASHLAYGQFHNTELENGTALHILNETEDILNL
jgi:hypothetical protein